MGKILFNGAASLLLIYFASPADAATLIERIKAAGFSCTAKSTGQLCTASANNAVGFKYSEPIAILLPSGVITPKKIIVNLHGWRGTCPGTNSTPEQIENDWQFIQQMISGGAADALMLFPMSAGNCATYANSLLPKFKAFTDWGKKLLLPTNTRWIFSGHSGAGEHLATALAAAPAVIKNTDAVFLLDATYRMTEVDSPFLDKWAEVVKQNGNVRIFTRYLVGASTEAGSKNLKNRLPANVDSAVSATSIHCRVPAVEIKNLLQRRYKKLTSQQLVSF